MKKNERQVGLPENNGIKTGKGENVYWIEKL